MLNIRIQKRATINTGNYSSIQPAVEAELINVKPEEFIEKTEALNTLVDSLFTVNMIEHAELQQLIKDNGLPTVLNAINIQGMKEDIKEALEILK